MKKMKITGEQEEALATYKRRGNGLSEFMDELLSLDPSFDVLQAFTPEQFALLLCGWYEVEPKFKSGDWAIHNNGSICEITHFDDCGFARGQWTDSVGVTGSLECPVENFKRKATKEEITQEQGRRKLEEVGRKPGEYKLADVVTHEFKKGLFEVSHHDEFRTLITNNFADTETKVDPLCLTLVTPVERRMDI